MNGYTLGMLVEDRQRELRGGAETIEALKQGLRRQAHSAMAFVAAWQYVGGKRDARLDLLRGFAVLAMVIDHVGGEASWLYPVTGGNRFFVSAAEGFVFLSGLVMGIVHAGLIVRQGLRAAISKALHRGRTLYVLTVVLTLGCGLLAYGLGLWWAPSVQPGAIGGYLVGVLTLHRAGYLTDVMLLYTLLLLASPPALVLLVRRRTPVLLAASLGLWALWQAWPDRVVVPWEIVDNSVFRFPAWQVLFVAGLVLGYHRSRFGAFAARIPRPALLLVSGGLVVGAIAAHTHGLVDGDGLLATQLLGKADVKPGRLLFFAVAATFAFTLTTSLWSPLRRVLGWLLMPLGQNALTAYALHLGAVAAVTAITSSSGLTRSAGVNTALQLAGLLAVWAVVVGRPAAGAWLRATLSPVAPPKPPSPARRLGPARRPAREQAHHSDPPPRGGVAVRAAT